MSVSTVYEMISKLARVACLCELIVICVDSKVIVASSGLGTVDLSVDLLIDLLVDLSVDRCTSYL